MENAKNVQATKDTKITKDSDGIRFERERAVVVRYRGHAIPGQRIDLIVENVVLVELKASGRIDPTQEAKVISAIRVVTLHE